MIYEQKLLTLAGIKKEFAEMQPELAAELCEDFLKKLPEIKNSAGDFCYGVITNKNSRTEYFCGVEIFGDGALPAGLQLLTVPPSAYAKFRHSGPIVTIGRTVQSIYGKWLPLCNWKRGPGPDLEIYPLDYDPKRETSVMEYSIPILT